MLTNAEFHKSFRSELRPVHLIVAIGVYALVILCAAVGNSYGLIHADQARMERDAQHFLQFLLVFHAVVSFGFAVLRTSHALGKERETQVLEAERLTALTPLELAWGKLLGLTTSLHLFNAVGLLLALPVAQVGRCSVGLTMGFFLLVTLGTMAYGAIGLLCASVLQRSDAAMRTAIGLSALGSLMAFTAEVPVLECASLNPAFYRLFGGPISTERLWPSFLGVPLPAEVLTAVFFGLLAWAGLSGTARMFGNPEGWPWQRGTILAWYSVVLATGTLFVLGHLGGVARYPRGDPEAIAMFHAVFWVFLAMFAIGSAPNRAAIEAELWQGPWSWRERLLGDRGSPTFFLAALAFLTTVVPTICFLPLALTRTVQFRGAAVAALGLGLGVASLVLISETARWLALTLVRDPRGATFALVAGLTLLPVFAAAALLERSSSWGSLFLCWNPVAAMAVLSDPPSRHPQFPAELLAILSLMLFWALAAGAGWLAYRATAEKLATIDEQRRRMLMAR